MIIQTVVMIFYAVLCAIADETIRMVYCGDDYIGSFKWLTFSIIIEVLVGAWIARGIF